MSYKEFLQELSTTKGWSLGDNQLIRQIKWGAVMRVCPICSVANKKAKKKLRYRLNYITAAKYLGLDTGIANIIANCADDNTFTMGNVKMRQELLVACKLTV